MVPKFQTRNTDNHQMNAKASGFRWEQPHTERQYLRVVGLFNSNRKKLFGITGVATVLSDTPKFGQARKRNR